MDASRFLALRPGLKPGGRYHQQVVDLGLLHVPSGRLEASDPFVNLGEGLVVAVPPGSYPVKVTIADVSDEQDRSHLRESYLSVVIADGTPARIEYLAPEGTEPAPPGEFYGVPVDAGTVGFADATAVAGCMPESDWYEGVFDTGEDDSWFALMDSSDHLVEGCANIVMPLAQHGENVVLAHSGWGDGFYPLVGSYDAAGNLLGVHIDLLINEPEDQTGDEEAEPDPAPEAPEPRPSLWKRLFGG